MQNLPTVSEDLAVNNVRWDSMPEPMRQYIRVMEVPPEGRVIEAEDGQPALKVFAYPKSTPNAEWTSGENDRRCDLIEKDLDGQLTPQEQLELELLEARLDRYVNRVAPLPLEQLRQLYQQTLEKAGNANGTPIP
jgi:hypothetical protein